QVHLIMAVRRNPFIVNGPVPPDAPVYVEREADRQLLEYCLNGEFVYVQAPRFLGKTSLLHRVAQRLKAEKVSVAVVDLQTLPTFETVGSEDWYEQLVTKIGASLPVPFNLSRLWLQQKESPLYRDKSPLQRLAAIFEEQIPETLIQRSVALLDGIEGSHLAP